MSFQIVNGYVCFDCSDVALAKKDINPAHPPSTPGAPPTNDDGSTSPSQGTPAVTFGGALSQLQGASAVQRPGGTSGVQPDPSPYQPQTGQTLRLTA